MRRPAQLVGMFFSRSGYTEAAKELARSLPPQTILLWDGGEIEYAVANGKLAVGAEVKLRYAMEEAESAFDIRAEFEP